MRLRCNAHGSFSKSFSPIGKNLQSFFDRTVFVGLFVLAGLYIYCGVLPLCATMWHIVAGLPTTIIQAQPKSAVATAAAAAKLPRGRKVPSLVPEFVCISVVQLDTLPPADTKRCLISEIGSIPKGSKFLSHVLIRKGGDIDHGTRFECSFGIYRSKSDFLAKAVQLVHPFDDLCPLKDDCIRMVFTLVTKGPLWVVNKRIEVLKSWTAKAKLLLADDRRLKSHLEAGVASVLASRKLLLLQFLADQVGWPDKEIVTLMQSGFDLVGNAPPSGVFDGELKPAEITTEKLVCGGSKVHEAGVAWESESKCH